MLGKSQSGSGILEREEYKDVSKLHSSIDKIIREYEDAKKLEWQKEVEENS